MVDEGARRDRPRTETQTLDPQDYLSAVKRTSWGAVFAGVVAGVSLQLLFAALGMAIGLTVVAGTDPSGRTMGIAAGLWWLITGTLSLFAAGWVAGRLSGVIRARDGGLHGFVTWGATTVLALYLTTTAVGQLVGGTMHAVTQTANAARPVLQGSPISNADVQGAADRASEATRELRENPQQAAERAASHSVGASWWMFFGLLLGAAAASVGGYLGTPTEPPMPTIRATTIKE